MIRNVFIFLALIWSGFSAPEDLLLSKSNLALFSPLQEVLQESSVVLFDEKSNSFGYGVLLSEDGYIFTKASLLHHREEYSVRLGKKKYASTFIKESREWDVALLKVDLEGGTPVVFSEEDLGVGEVIISNGVTSLLKRRIKFGVISAKAREIPVQVAVLDFYAAYEEEKKGFIVEGMVEGGAAELAGLKEGDLIISIDGQALNDPEMFLMDLYEGKWPDERAEVLIYREGKEETLSLPYLWRHEVLENPQDRNEAMSGRISGRRTGFPKVIQHDIALTKRTVGGPVLNLEGKCVGMNIARYSRAETFALPAVELKALYKEMSAE